MRLIKLLGLCGALLLSPFAASAQALPEGYNCFTAPNGSTPFDPLYVSKCAPLGQGGVSDETQGYAGLTWKFGSNLSEPIFSVGVRSVQGMGADRVRGIDVSAGWKVKDKFAFENVKAGAFVGNGDGLASVGGVYSFATKEVSATASVESGPIRLGADYGLRTKLITPFVSLTSLSNFEENAAGCEDGFMPTTNDETDPSGVIVFADPAQLGFDLNGAFCLQQGPEDR